MTSETHNMRVLMIGFMWLWLLIVAVCSSSDFGKVNQSETEPSLQFRKGSDASFGSGPGEPIQPMLPRSMYVRPLNSDLVPIKEKCKCLSVTCTGWTVGLLFLIFVGIIVTLLTMRIYVHDIL